MRNARFLLPSLVLSALVFCGCVTHGEARRISTLPNAVSSAASSVSSLRSAAPRTVKASSSVRSRNFRSAPASFHAKSSAPVVPLEQLKIPVLVYHHIRENQGWAPETWSAKMSISPAGFDRQMQWLKDHGYESIDLDTYAGMMKGEIGGPAKPVVITFDDNHTSQYEYAVPSMEKRGLIGVIYIVAQRIGAPGTMTREQLKELSDKGHDIESHTMTHRVLTLLGVKDMEWEFVESAKILSEIIGKPVRHLAYPGTSHNATVREQLKKAGYVTGSIMDPRVATAKDDFFKMPRIMMIDSTDLKRYLP